MAIARALGVPGRWTYNAADGRRIDARGPWQHPLLAGFWRLTGWVFILSCWLPVFFEESPVNMVLSCVRSSFLVSSAASWRKSVPLAPPAGHCAITQIRPSSTCVLSGTTVAR